jgi:hypothetical protein
MAPKNPITRTFLDTGILLVLLASLLLQPVPALAIANADSRALPSFSEFSRSVRDGSADLARGVYVPNVMAFPIVQQPSGSPAFLSNEQDKVTQFRMASQYGTTGLLAHNYLAGDSFFDLEVGDEVRLVYGDGKVEYFIVSEILRYQALQPNSPYSSFRSLDKGEVLSAEKMFKRVFSGDGHLTFQTCIEKDGELSWGRLFVIAAPKAEYEALDPMKIR